MCSPSRASALYGLLPPQTGIYRDNDSWRQKFPDGRYAAAPIDFLGGAHGQPVFLGVGLLRTQVPW